MGVPKVLRWVFSVNFSFVLLGRVLRPNLLYELSLLSCSATNHLTLDLL